jgi:hypothetical protein
VSAEHCLHITTANCHKPVVWIFGCGCASLQMRPHNQTQQSLLSWSKLSYLHYYILHRISTGPYLIARKFNKLLHFLWGSQLLVVMKLAMTTRMSETNPSIAISTNQGGANRRVPIPAVNELNGPSRVSL